jgi:hypothetical protein
MNYHISRDGQQFGPYTLAEVQRYVADGNILLTDLACCEGMDRWVTVQQILGNIPAQPHVPISPNYGQVPAYAQPPYGAAAVQPVAVSPGVLPPDLHWALVLVFGIFCGVFLPIWMFVEAGYVKKLRPDTKCMMWYGIGITAAILGYILFIAGASEKEESLMGVGFLVILAATVMIVVGHFSLKNSLEEYFNAVEPINLQLSGVMTFFFNVIYFQYHFNWIRQYKLTGIRRQ